MAAFLMSREAARKIFLKPLFTEIEKNNCFSIYTRSDLNKIREETVKTYDLIDGSNHAKVSKQIFAEFSNMAIHKFITSQTTA